MTHVLVPLLGDAGEIDGPKGEPIPVVLTDVYAITVVEVPRDTMRNAAAMEKLRRHLDPAFEATNRALVFMESGYCRFFDLVPIDRWDPVLREVRPLPDAG